MVEALAREYLCGRQLIIGITNLDAERRVTWTITRIAATGHPNTAALVRKVLLTSASLPGAFPPVHFTVESASGERFDEMHVDGRTT